MWLYNYNQGSGESIHTVITGKEIIRGMDGQMHTNYNFYKYWNYLMAHDYCLLFFNNQMGVAWEGD